MAVCGVARSVECRKGTLGERLLMAAHRPSASGSRLPCCAKMQLATGASSSHVVRDAMLIISGCRVRLTGSPTTRVMKLVGTADLKSAAIQNACRFDSGLRHQRRPVASSDVDSRRTQIFLNFASIRAWQERNENPPARVPSENR